MVEGFGLRLGGGGCGQGSLGLSGGAGLRQKADLLVDGPTKVVEGLSDVGRVVIGLVGVLGAVVRRGSSSPHRSVVILFATF